ncbi:MAG: hypothetical protein IT306_30565 [Chloroflexi bacterium]|nr:hypothetical protein [Chloroflexota bacterium]
MHSRLTARRASAPLLLSLFLALLVLGGPSAPGRIAFADSDDLGDEDPFTINPLLVEQAERESDLGQFVNDTPDAEVIPERLRTRRALLAERARLRASGDMAGVARLNSVLASEAFERSAVLTAYWLDRRDAPTGLFPHTLHPDGRVWSYGDAGSDLFPFLGIATAYLIPDRYDEILGTLAAERRLTRGLPEDVSLDTLLPVEREPEKAMLNVVEYAKDGLLPLVEALGSDPWLYRLQEVMDAVIINARTPTPNGPIPSPAAEVNGSALQALARLTWATDDPQYVQAGRRIAAAYLDHALPTTEYIPPHRWDFMENEPIGPRRFYLGDHGNEIVAGLVEWHRVEVKRGLPEAEAHREAINKMLDRLLQKGRSPEGLWYAIVDVPSGKVRDKDLNDNWGYLGQAYLDQAATERTSATGDLAAAARYEQSAATMLRAVTLVDFYEWERGTMDGYADTLESALYLLRYLDDPLAADWVDEQVAVLYGYQHDDGSVTDENIDGNFVRTTLLYGLSLTRGARLEPWTPTVALGAAPDGPCLRVHLHSSDLWRGELHLDVPRHREHLRLGSDYPRLNQWPEWWSVERDRRYALSYPDGTLVDVDGATLADGLRVTVAPGSAYELQVCPR